MRVAVLDRMVPKQMVADGWHSAMVHARNARRTYSPHRPGARASSWVEPSSARSLPRTGTFRAWTARNGIAAALAAARAASFASARRPIRVPRSPAKLFQSGTRRGSMADRISIPPDARLPTASRPMRRPIVLFTWLLIATPVLAADVPDDWAFKPVRRPAIPTVHTAAASPIDAFLIQKLEAAGLA